jgi:hypothetical protein
MNTETTTMSTATSPQPTLDELWEVIEKHPDFVCGRLIDTAELADFLCEQQDYREHDELPTLETVLAHKDRFADGFYSLLSGNYGLYDEFDEVLDQIIRDLKAGREQGGEHV